MSNSHRILFVLFVLSLSSVAIADFSDEVSGKRITCVVHPSGAAEFEVTINARRTKITVFGDIYEGAEFRSIKRESDGDTYVSFTGKSVSSKQWASLSFSDREDGNTLVIDGSSYALNNCRHD